jgi:hypothetical protein
MPVLRGRGPVIAALAVIAAVVVVDIVIASDRVAVTSLVIAAPLLCGVTAAARATVRIGVLSVITAAAAFVWGPSPATVRYWIPPGVVTVGSAFAVVMARFRGKAERDAGRLRVLADVAQIAHGGEPVEAIARAVVEVLVPRVADLCAIDITGLAGTRLLLGETAPEPMVVRNVVKATGEERWLLNEAPAVTDSERPGTGRSRRPADPLHRRRARRHRGERALRRDASARDGALAG